MPKRIVLTDHANVALIERSLEMAWIERTAREPEETNMSVRLHYDAKTDAAYLRFSGESVVESEEVAPGVVLDYDAEGRMVGMEVLRAREHLPADALVAAE